MERRTGHSAIPSDTESYLNAQQQLGLITLKEYGWSTLCVRHPSVDSVKIILKNKHNRLLGILCEDGALRFSESLRVRDSRSQEADDVNGMVASISQQVNKNNQS